MRYSSQGYQGYREQQRLARVVRRFICSLLLLMLGFHVVSSGIIGSVIQRSEAMEPTLAPGDRFFFVPLLYGPRLPLFQSRLPGFASPSRGDLVVVTPDSLRDDSRVQRLLDPVVRFFTLQRRTALDTGGLPTAHQIKRVIGLPGDTVRIERFTAFVRPAGEGSFQNESTLTSQPYRIIDLPLPEEWLPDDPFGSAMQDIVLQEDEFFLLSDNRLEGIDSRHWGPVSQEALLARIWIRYWPFNRAGSL